MVRKITALLMVLTVAALCAVPSFAESTSLYYSLYMYLSSTGNNQLQALNNANKLSIEGANSNQRYTVGSSLKIFNDSDKSFSHYLEYPYTYHFNCSIRFNNSSAINQFLDTYSFSLLSSTGNYFALLSPPFNFQDTTVNTFYFYNLTTLNQFSRTIVLNTSSPYTIDFDIVFRVNSPLVNNNLCFICPLWTFAYTGSSDVDIYITNLSMSSSYDIDSNTYNQAVLNQVLQVQQDIADLNNSIDSGFSQNHQDNVAINNNLSVIDSSLDGIDQSVKGVGDKVDDMSSDLQQKMDDLQQQERDDVEADYSDAEEAGEALEEGVDLSFTESISQLFNAISYSGTSFSFKLPASGTIPLLNAQLWNQTEIPLRQYINMMPPVVLIVIRLLLGLGFALFLVHEIRSIISMINGAKGD